MSARTVNLIDTVGRGICSPVIQVGKILPGAQMFSTTDENRAIRLRYPQLRAAEKAAASQCLTIPTIR